MTILKGERAQARHFPLELLGSFWQGWVSGAAKAASAPADYVVVSLLAAASALLANTRWPIAGARWKEPPILWCMLVGSPSAGKSPALDSVADLIRHTEDQMASGFDLRLREYETQLAAANARREEWEKGVKTAIANGEEPRELPADACAPDPIVRPRIRVSDCTTEKLGALSAGHEGGLLLVRDELSGWFGSFDRYGGGAGSDRAFAIEMYGGRPYVIDRVKSPLPLTIPHLSVSVVGGIQPDKLNAITSGPDDGLAARFLYCWPDTNLDFALARELLDNRGATDAFAKLLGLRPTAHDKGNSEPLVVRLEVAAENCLEEFSRQMMRDGLDATGPYAGSLGKARGHVLRLAAILEYLWWSASAEHKEPDLISLVAVNAAAAAVRSYFLPMAARVFNNASKPEAMRNAATVIRHVRKNSLRHFNGRMLRRGMNGRVREASEMNAACEVLETANLIRQVDAHGPGRIRKDFEVNPIVFEHK